MVTRCVSVEASCGPGGRRIRIDDEVLGTAYSLRDLAVFLRHAGLVGWDELDVAESDLIEWHGGGPEVWARQVCPDGWAGPEGGPASLV
ncbi:hypothetical protein [Streptomyces sp. CA-106131]|uniref:hypothetical protein n=1 Tax=Streptomyces sp. CA-106131 TaxID=3240045 RepID=UPI003D8C3755